MKQGKHRDEKGAWGGPFLIPVPRGSQGYATVSEKVPV